MDKYLELAKTLNKEQKNLLVEIDDDHCVRMIKEYDKGFANGKLEGYKEAMKFVIENCHGFVPDKNSMI